MKHNQLSNGLVGDIVEPVNMQNVNGKMVARTRIGFVEERFVKGGAQGQKELHRSSFQAEAWGETAKLLASVPVGHTVIFTGKIQNQKYQDKSTGQERWFTKWVIFGLGVVGPSMYPLEHSGTQNSRAAQYPNNQAYPPNQYGQAPGGQQSWTPPAQNPQGVWPPPQQVQNNVPRGTHGQPPMGMPQAGDANYEADVPY